MKEIAEKLIADLEEECEKDIYIDDRISAHTQELARIARNGALILAILKIKIAFDLPLID